MRMEIQASVGLYGANIKSDVEAVQQSLNTVSPDVGGAAPQLKVDGICGPKTRAAILNFQRCNFGDRLADGRIDPRGPTLSKLNELLAQIEDPKYAELLRALDEFIEYAQKHPIPLKSLEYAHAGWKQKAERFQNALLSYGQIEDRKNSA